MDAISMVAGGLFLAAMPFADDHAANTTKVVTRVVKAGRSSPGELQRLGVDVAGLDALIADAVKRAIDDVKAGRTPEAATVERHLTSNGASVEAHVEMISGEQALQEFERRFPELKDELDELQRSFGDPPCRRAGRARPAPEPASEPAAKPAARPAPVPATGPAARPATAPAPAKGAIRKPLLRPAPKAATNPSSKTPAKPAAAPLADPAVKTRRDAD